MAGERVGRAATPMNTAVLFSPLELDLAP